VGSSRRNSGLAGGVYIVDRWNYEKGEAMTTETKSMESEPRERKVIYRNGVSTPLYGLGFLGALVYYLGHAATLWLAVLGFFKAVVWPAMLVYELLKYLNM
jgi:hypothetical protein